MARDFWHKRFALRYLREIAVSSFVLSTGSLRSRRSRRYSDALIFMVFRGPQAQVNQLRKSSDHCRLY
jgi:hypothetical protein